MPPVIIPVAITAAAGAVGVAAGVTTLASAALSVGVTAVTAGAQYLMTPKGGAGVVTNPEAQPAQINGFRAVPMRQAIPPRRFVFGRTRVGGAVLFQDNNNPNLYICSALSDGPIDAIEGVYFGDVNIPLDGSGNAATGQIYTSHFSLEKRLGTLTQTASTKLLAAFTSLDSNFKQAGVAAPVAVLDWGSDAQNNATLWGGSVDPSYLVRGVLMYDPRDPTQSVIDESTWKYATNPALFVAFVLIKAWKVALDPSYIDWSSVATAANVCDATLTYHGATVATFVGAGVFQSGADLASQLAQMLSAFDGAILYVDGKYQLYADAARSSVWTVTDDDIYDLPEFPFDSEARDRFQAIKASYYDATGAGTAKTTDVFELSAGGRETSINFPFTSEEHSAQILAYRALQRMQVSQSFNLTVSDAGLWLAPFDVITIASSVMPFLNGSYVVQSLEPIQDGVTLLLKPYSAAVYADPAGYLV